MGSTLEEMACGQSEKSTTGNSSFHFVLRGEDGGDCNFMEKLTPEQIEAVINAFTTESLGIIRFGSSGTYEQINHDEAVEILKQIGE